MSLVRQTNFSAGELNPLLWGRTDLPVFGRGARTLRNFFPSRQGAAVSRPGTEYVATAKALVDGTGAPIIGVTPNYKLVPFFAGDEVAYALEFGNFYVRFYARGEQVLAGGAPYEVPTPYSNDDVLGLKYAQTGDVLTLTHPEHDARELRILAPANWQLSIVDFTPLPAFFGDPEAPGSATTGFAMVDDGSGLFPSPQAADADHPAREWQWQFTTLLRDRQTGAVFETLGQLVSESFHGNFDATAAPLASDEWAIFSDRPIVLLRADTFNPANLLPRPADWDTRYEILAFNAYRGRGGLFGFIGQTKSRRFVDVGEEPDYTTQPPVGTQPFGSDTEVVAGVTRHLDRPWTVGFFQERRVFAGSTLKPETVHTSVTGDYDNFDTRLAVHVAGEALEFTLAARKREEVRAILTRQRLLVFTGASVWSVGGSQGSPIDFDDLDARVEDEAGATHLQPIVVEGSALYCRAKGIGVRALVASDQFSSYQGVDVSELAQHLFLGANKQLVDWCYAKDPWGLIWAVRADGALLSFTHNGQVWGWARHDTAGRYVAVASVPEGDEDAVYVAVQRTVAGAAVTYIERMTSRVHRVLPTDPAPTFPELWPDDVCVDCALEYFGPPVTSFTELDALEGLSGVYVLARGQDPVGPFTVTGGVLVDARGDVVDVYDDPPPTNAVNDAGAPIFVARIGLLFTPQLETLDVAAGEMRTRKKVVARIGLEVDNSVGLEVGPSFDALEEWIQREPDDDGFRAISMATELVDIPVEGDWDTSARACLQQSAPRPVTVVGLSRILVPSEEE